MPRLNREESQARTRERLIEAARSEIVKKGFALASVRDIADAAGFSQGAFYSNFPDKEAILLELVQRHQSEERGKIEAALSRAQGDAAAAMQGIEKWSATVNADPGFAVLAIELQLQALRSPKFAIAYNELNRKHRNGHVKHAVQPEPIQHGPAAEIRQRARPGPDDVVDADVALEARVIHSFANECLECWPREAHADRRYEHDRDVARRVLLA